eukprot:9057964-Pyramimonas_sp.AAC.1
MASPTAPDGAMRRLAEPCGAPRRPAGHSTTSAGRSTRTRPRRRRIRRPLACAGRRLRLLLRWFAGARAREPARRPFSP